MRNPQWPRHQAISPSVNNHRFGGSRGTQHNSLTAHTLIGQLLKAFIPFCHVIKWPPQTILQRGSLFVGKNKTFPDHLNLYWFDVCSKYWALWCSSSRSTSKFLKILSSCPTNVTKLAVIKHRLSSHICFQRHVSETHRRPGSYHVYWTSDCF